MLIDFFYHLRAHKLPVSVQEYLTLLEALRQRLMAPTLDDFYFLARTALVKDESLYDRYDAAFGAYYRGIAAALPADRDIPLDWLIKEFEKTLTPEEKAAIEAHGWDKLMELFKQRLEEQQERHAGGSKWIGTGGTSPFGNGGYHPEGIRVGGDSAGNRTAVKVWDMRQFRDYDDQLELGTRNFKVALRRLRRFARQGRRPGTGPGRHHRQHGAQRRPPRPAAGARAPQYRQGADAAERGRQHGRPHRARGGTVFGRTQRVPPPRRLLLPQLPVRKPLAEQPPAPERALRNLGRPAQVQRRLAPDHRRRRHHEPVQNPAARGSVEHYNKEAGAVWLRRLLDAWPKAAWLNPEPTASWRYRQSIALLRDIMQDRMYPVTVAGLEQAMRQLSK
ncbi:Uncharacterized protein conserved in bacteria [Bordetella holmesii]|nr:Uncharacterized protein conserved in bacteria [Bordetella holmesii]